MSEEGTACVEIRSRWTGALIVSVPGEALTQAKLYGADLTGANLKGADLTGAKLTRANLYGADLHRAHLKWADLTSADLRGADLTGAELYGTNLTRANLTGTNLTGADLTRANLRWADLYGTNLTRAKLNWQSHALISEILWRSSGTPSQEQLAAWIGRKTDWCWDEWLAVDHPDREWALDVLAGWVLDGDSAPEILRERKGKKDADNE